MDPHQPFSYGWDNHVPTYGFLAESSRQEGSNADNFNASYQDPIQAPLANDAPSNNDVHMGNDDMGHLLTVQATPRRKRGPTRRKRSENLDWNKHKKTIKELYITQNKTLPETKEEMEQLHSFNAS